MVRRVSRTVGRLFHGACTACNSRKRARVVLQEQVVLHFAIGCQDRRASGKLIKSPHPTPFTADEAVHRMRTYALSLQALKPCCNDVRMVSVDIQSLGLGHISRGRVPAANRGIVPVGKKQPVGSPVGASSASSWDIIEGNVQRDGQRSPQLLKMYLLIQK